MTKMKFLVKEQNVISTDVNGIYDVLAKISLSRMSVDA